MCGDGGEDGSPYPVCDDAEEDGYPPYCVAGGEEADETCCPWCPYGDRKEDGARPYPEDS
jgi:hypothetical protein